MSDERAIIDIGSNTIRLVIYNGPARAPVVLLNEKVTPRLGKDVAACGRMSDKAMKLALAALARYAALLRMRGVSDVETVATAAVREAANRDEFIAGARVLGLSPRVLTGEEEARTSAMGVIAAFPGARGVVGDMGGGSLELVAVDGETCSGAVTLPFGTLRLPALRAKGADGFARHIRKGLKQAGWNSGAGQPFYIVGGSWRALALQCMKMIAWPIDDPHDFELPADQAIRLCATLARGDIGAPDPRISASRLASLPDAAALLGVLVERMKPSRIIFSSWGLREGLIYRRLDPETRAQDPMLAGVAAFAADAGVSFTAAEKATRWTGGALSAEDAQAGNLRLAATLLALASLRSEPNLRADQAIAWALRKRWIGLDARGRAMLAMTVFANTGHTEVPEALVRLASKEDFRRATAWGLALRLCRKLSGGAEQVLDETGLRRMGNRLVLEMRGQTHVLVNPSVERNLSVLADWLGLDWTIEYSRANRRAG